MKLIDILVQELPNRGGWPDGIEEIWQDYDGLIRPGAFGWNHNQIAEDHRRKHEDAHVKINRKQYEAALAARKPEWDGEGLPPVGCECEHHSPSGMVTVVKIIAHFQNRAAMVAVFIPVEREFKTVDQAISDCFRPIRSEADKKRDEAIDSIASLIDYRRGCSSKPLAKWIFDEISAGKIPHIRID